MSIIPDILIGTSTGAAAIMTTLQSHWGGTSTKFALTGGVAYDAGDSLNITPIADPGVASNWQINMRRTSTTAFKVVLEPTGSITDAGSTGAGPTGLSTMASFEDDWVLVTAASPITWVLWEWDDAVMFIAREATNTYHYQGFHTGRIFNPAVLGVPGLSDGFGNLCGAPIVTAGSGAVWFAGTCSDASVRVSDTGIQATDWARYVIGQTSYSGITISSGNLGGYYYPGPISLIASTNQPRMAGTMRYLFVNFPADTADTRLENPSSGTDRWIHLTTTVGTAQLVAPWPDATTPK